jgi:hypothetical protein
MCLPIVLSVKGIGWLRVALLWSVVGQHTGRLTVGHQLRDKVAALLFVQE